MKAVVATFNQEKALVGAFSVITNLRMDLFEALENTGPEKATQKGILLCSYFVGLAPWHCTCDYFISLIILCDLLIINKWGCGHVEATNHQCIFTETTTLYLKCIYVVKVTGNSAGRIICLQSPVNDGSSLNN